MPATEVKSARRVLEVLEYFAEHHSPATVTEISTYLNYPQSSTSMLLGSLQSMGYLQYEDDARTYRPTLRVMLLGAWMHDELYGEGSLVSSMDRLRRRTGHTVIIGARHGIHARFMLVLRGVRRQAPRYAAGSLVPLCRSAIGKMLLVDENETTLARIIRRANAESPEPDRVSVAETLREIAQCRTQGWAQSTDYPIRGLAALAIRLPDLEGHPPMALGVGASKAEIIHHREEIVDALRDAFSAVRAAKPKGTRGNPAP